MARYSERRSYVSPILTVASSRRHCCRPYSCVPVRVIDVRQSGERSRFDVFKTVNTAIAREKPSTFTADFFPLTLASGIPGDITRGNGGHLSSARLSKRTLFRFPGGAEERLSRQILTPVFLLKDSEHPGQRLVFTVSAVDRLPGMESARCDASLPTSIVVQLVP